METRTSPMRMKLIIARSFPRRIATRTLTTRNKPAAQARIMNIAYADEVNYCAQFPAPNCYPHTYYAKQTGGPSAYNPPAAPPPSTFSTNIPVGSPGGEPGIRIDSHNCIFVAAP